MRNILIYTTALLAILSCIKDDPTDGAPSDVITIAPYVPQTKVAGYINTNANFAGSKMVVYDYLRANVNSPTEGASGWYMNGVSLVCDRNGNWDYADAATAGQEFLWIDQSRNTFFGWLDMTGSWYQGVALPSPSFDKENCTLSVPSITFTAGSPVYDFMYSEVYDRYYAKVDQQSPEVPLQMKHLFTAFAFGVSNGTNSEVVLKEFSINGLCSTNSASIDFDSAATVTYGEGTRSTGVYVQKTGADITLGAGERYADVFNTTAPTPQDMIMWPLDGAG